ncbi:hypothetical protein B0H16DRAFT_1687892 [Mycena metata]|uniref:Uncharacterized protein n=1 Tax=Mycena metata TaxID=1033252 RepID=A0AAD7NJV5_9AGAR|nr:hypothetical protein B0H16DRAFT_1687892 [Mycena metata]
MNRSISPCLLAPMLRIPLSGTKSLCQRLGFRGFTSLPIRRPRRFWDFHVPEGAWGYRPRDTKKLWAQPSDFHERARNWVSVPDANLPAPWSCNWRYWPYAAAMFEGQPVETSIAAYCALSDAPLTPVSAVPSLRVRALAIIEAADWNRIKRLELAGNANIIEASSIAPALPLGSGQGFRVVAQEPYQKSTLWDMCPPPFNLPDFKFFRAPNRVCIFKLFVPRLYSTTLGWVAHVLAPLRVFDLCHPLIFPFNGILAVLATMQVYSNCRSTLILLVL